MSRSRFTMRRSTAYLRNRYSAGSYPPTSARLTVRYDRLIATTSRLFLPSRGPVKRRPDLVILAILATATVLYCRGVLVGLWNWGHSDSDWDQHLLYSWSTYRSLMEFSELPLWNPWYLGGNPQLGNPQVHFPTPMLLFDLAAGPVLGMKLKILAHHWLGLVGTYWLGRQVGLSRYARTARGGSVHAVHVVQPPSIRWAHAISFNGLRPLGARLYSASAQRSSAIRQHRGLAAHFSR